MPHFICRVVGRGAVPRDGGALRVVAVAAVRDGGALPAEAVAVCSIVSK